MHKPHHWTTRGLRRRGGLAKVLDSCAYCGELRALVKSHAIPDAIFKDLKANRGGSLRQIHQDYGISTTTTSGYARLLCDECEGHFNNVCDSDVIAAVRQSAAGKGAGKCSHETLAYFTCSVLWRALESSAKIYSGYNIPAEDRAKIEDVVFGHCQPLSAFSFEVATLFDGQGKLSGSKLSQTIAVPYCANTTIGRQTYSIHHFIVRGIFMAALSPRVPLLVNDFRYLTHGGISLPRAIRDIRTLSSFRKIDHLAEQEAQSG